MCNKRMVICIVANSPAIAPLGEAKPNIEVFRLLAKRMGFEDACLDDNDEEVCRQALRPSSHGCAI